MKFRFKCNNEKNEKQETNVTKNGNTKSTFQPRTIQMENRGAQA